MRERDDPAPRRRRPPRTRPGLGARSYLRTARLGRGRQYETLERRYRVLLDRALSVDPTARPFVGDRGADERTVAFLREQGHVVTVDDDASSCAVSIDEAVDATLETDVQRLEFVESARGPLLRFWRWPDEAKSAFCFVGDLDALSPREYARRLLPLPTSRSP